MTILNWSLVGVHVRTHMNIRLAHVLVDDYVSQVMDIEMSNQLCGHMLWNMGFGQTQLETLRECNFSLVQCLCYVLRPEIVVCTRDV